MDSTDSPPDASTDTDRMERLLRLLHGVRAEVREHLQGQGAPAWHAWEQLNRELAEDAGPGLEPDPTRCEELEVGLKKAHDCLEQLRAHR